MYASLMELSDQVAHLFLLAIPIACISWTITHEEVFREPRDFCVEKSKSSNSLPKRKFFYLFTCEYCFSHYVAVFFLILTKYHLLYPDWKGYLIAGFALVWIANIYMSLFGFMRAGLKLEKLDADFGEIKLKATKSQEAKMNSTQSIH